DGAVVDGRFPPDEQINDSQHCQQDAAGDLEILKADPQEGENRLAADDEGDAGGGCHAGSAQGDAAALLDGIPAGDGDVYRYAARGINDDEERDEDQEKVVENGRHRDSEL